jgi:hypothetical protein
MTYLHGRLRALERRCVMVGPWPNHDFQLMVISEGRSAESARVCSRCGQPAEVLRIVVTRVPDRQVCP